MVADVLVSLGHEFEIEGLSCRSIGHVEGVSGRAQDGLCPRSPQFAVTGLVDHLGQPLGIGLQELDGMNQLLLGQGEGGGHDRFGEEIIEARVDLVAQVKHAVLDSNRLLNEEKMEPGVLPQSRQGLRGNPGGVRFALLEDLGHQEGRL